ncbi:unnamed protein product [Cutaneotrichosporon oleaginosum]
MLVPDSPLRPPAPASSSAVPVLHPPRLAPLCTDRSPRNIRVMCAGMLRGRVRAEEQRKLDCDPGSKRDLHPEWEP